MIDPEEGKSPKKLRQKISDLRMEKRVGKYTSDPNNPSRGIYPAPAEEQKEFKQNLKQKIREARGER